MTCFFPNSDIRLADLDFGLSGAWHCDICPNSGDGYLSPETKLKAKDPGNERIRNGHFSPEILSS